MSEVFSMNMKKKEQLLLSLLRANSRMKMTRMSKFSKIPVSTVHDMINKNYNHIVTKYTALVDFAKVGYSTRVQLILKVKPEERKSIKEHLMKKEFINSFYKINNGYDFMTECIFSSMRELEEFLDSLEQQFGIIEKKVYHIIDEIRKEHFMSSPYLALQWKEQKGKNGTEGLKDE
jgi:DNA-binding Lrp family transcriptional regulator